MEQFSSLTNGKPVTPVDLLPMDPLLFFTTVTILPIFQWNLSIHDWSLVECNGQHSFFFLRKNSYFVLDSVMPVTESHWHEFKTGGGRYPITILPEV